MLVIICFFYLLMKTATSFHQTDYIFDHHRMEVTDYNPAYFRNVKAALVPLNRTTRAFNFSFDCLVELTQAIPISLSVFKLSMNDYRTFPISMDVDYCKLQKENMFGINDLENYSNLTHCPLKKGYYYINKYRPDDSKFPPHLFPGDFKIVAKLMYVSDFIAELHWYGAIKPIEKLWN